MAVAVLSLTANAFTIDQLISGGEYLVGEFTTLYGYPHSEVIQLKPGADNKHIILHNVYGCLDFNYTMVNSYSGNKETSNGAAIKIYDNTPNCGGSWKGQSDWWMLAGVAQRPNFIANPGGASHFINITKNNDGSFTYTTNNAFTLYSRKYDGYYNDYYYTSDYVYDDDRIFVKGCTYTRVPYEMNADVTDVQKSYTGYASGSDMVTTILGEVKRNYKAHVDFNFTNNTFSIFNFANNGYAYDQNKRKYCLGGTIDPVNHKLIFDLEKTVAWHGGIAYPNGSSYRAWPFYLCAMTINHNSSKFDADDELIADYKEKYIHHNEVEHGWVSNGGERKTFAGYQIDIPNYVYYSPQVFRDDISADYYYDGLNRNLNARDNYCQTHIEVAPDVTHQAEINNVMFGADATNGVYISGTYYPTENPQYVDHYDLYLTQQGITHVAGRSDLCTNHGFTHGMCISDSRYDIDWVGKSAQTKSVAEASSDNAFTYNKLIPASELANFNHTQPLSIYLKAHYKEGINAENEVTDDLTPTFHALTLLGSPNTSIEDVLAGTAATVKAAKGCIVIEGTDTKAEVYTADGRLVYAGTDRTIAVANGIYVVRIANNAHKVIVK